jgi:hypothetical protein
MKNAARGLRLWLAHPELSELIRLAEASSP